MRRALVGVLLVGSLAGLKAQAPMALDARIEGGVTFEDPRARPECHAADSLHEIAVQADLDYGFENTSECWKSMFPEKPTGPQLTARTAREAIDLLVAAMPRFAWKERNGVAVVRPTVAWTDPHDILNLPTGAFQATNAPLNHALYFALHAVTPTLLYPQHQTEPRGKGPTAVSVKFGGGTLLDALDELVRAKHQAFWLVGYRGEPKHGSVGFRTFTYKDGGGGAAYPVSLPQPSSR